MVRRMGREVEERRKEKINMYVIGNRIEIYSSRFKNFFFFLE